MSKLHRNFRFLNCELIEPTALKVTIQGEVPENLEESLCQIREIKDALATFALRTWEKIVFIGTEITKKAKGLAEIVLTLRRDTVPFEQLLFHTISHTGQDEISPRLAKTNRLDAAVIAAEFATTNGLPAVTAIYRQGDSEGKVRVVNHNIYKKVHSASPKVERFVKETGCILLRDH